MLPCYDINISKLPPFTCIALCFWGWPGWYNIVGPGLAGLGGCCEDDDVDLPGNKDGDLAGGWDGVRGLGDNGCMHKESHKRQTCKDRQHEGLSNKVNLTTF